MNYKTFFVELQKSYEPLKHMSGNLNRMNTLIILCNKRLDILDLKMVALPENIGKCKEPPGFDKALTNIAKNKYDNT